MGNRTEFTPVRTKKGTMMRGKVSKLETGTATAEFAVVLPAVMVVALLLFSSAKAVLVSMNCQETANVAARELMVSGGDASIAPLVTRVAGGRATAATSKAGDEITVRVRCPVLPGPLGVLPASVEGYAVGVLHE